MPDIKPDEYQKLVEIIATSVGADFGRARYLVDTAARVVDSIEGKGPADAIKVLAICLATFGAAPSQVYNVRENNIPHTPEVDPVALAAARRQLDLPIEGEEDDDHNE